MEKRETRPKFYKSLFQNSFEASFIFDDTGKILEANKAFCQLFNYTEEYLVGQSLKLLFSFEEDYDELIGSLIEEKEIDREQNQLLNSTGHGFECNIRCRSIDNEETLERLFHGVIYNVQDHVDKQAGLLFAQTMATSRQIARSMGHEIRNPLTNLNLALEQLSEELSADEETKLYIDIISRNATRIEQLMSEMLESTKPKEVELEMHDINKLVANWLKKLIRHVDENVISVKTDLLNELPLVAIDPEYFFLAFKNIFLNAVQAVHGKDGAIINVGASLVNDTVTLFVEDNGVGISEGDAAKVFYPFFSTGHKRGVGLGLTEVQNIVLAHEGRVSVSSKLGEGSIFSIIFKH